MPILIDTSVLFAYAFSKDIRHTEASQFLRETAHEHFIIPAPILSELFYLTTVRVNYPRAVELFSTVQEAFQIEALTEADMSRMKEIMDAYASAEFDFADTALMAQAERLNISQIATFDRRDFSIFRPTHTAYLELVP